MEFDEDFAKEFADFDSTVKIELRAQMAVRKIHGPSYGRPRVDTLNGSKHANMKELRFDAADGIWGVAFAFDPSRNAVLLVAGDKSGVNERRFYKKLIKTADLRFDTHLQQLKKDG